MTRLFEPTAEQRHAILFPLADCCVVAGAGSGKTAVLTRRFVHLALEHGLEPPDSLEGWIDWDFWEYDLQGKRIPWFSTTGAGSGSET